MASIIFETKRFQSWNLPNVMIEAATWIQDEEINVSDMSIYPISVDADSEEGRICTTNWLVDVEYAH